MGALLEMRNLIAQVYTDTIDIPAMTPLYKVMQDTLLQTSLAGFDDGYDSFMKQIHEVPALFDSWLLFLYDISSATESIEAVTKELELLNKNIQAKLPGGPAIQYQFDYNDVSFVVSFVYRITISLLTEKKEEVTDGK